MCIEKSSFRLDRVIAKLCQF